MAKSEASKQTNLCLAIIIFVFLVVSGSYLYTILMHKFNVEKDEYQQYEENIIAKNENYVVFNMTTEKLIVGTNDYKFNNHTISINYFNNDYSMAIDDISSPVISTRNGFYVIYLIKNEQLIVIGTDDYESKVYLANFQGETKDMTTEIKEHYDLNALNYLNFDSDKDSIIFSGDRMIGAAILENGEEKDLCKFSDENYAIRFNLEYKIDTSPYATKRFGEPKNSYTIGDYKKENNLKCNI